MGAALRHRNDQRRPGYYYAESISGPSGIIGAAAVKVSLDELQSPWRRDPNRAAIVVDSDGVIILASEPGWKYRTLAPLPSATLARFRATRQFENVSLDPLEIRVVRVLAPEARLVSVSEGEDDEAGDFLLQERQLSSSNWKMIVLSDLDDLHTLVRAVQIATGLGLGLARSLCFFSASGDAWSDLNWRRSGRSSGRTSSWSGTLSSGRAICWRRRTSSSTPAGSPHWASWLRWWRTS